MEGASLGKAAAHLYLCGWRRCKLAAAPDACAPGRGAGRGPLDRVFRIQTKGISQQAGPEAGGGVELLDHRADTACLCAGGVALWGFGGFVGRAIPPSSTSQFFR